MDEDERTHPTRHEGGPTRREILYTFLVLFLVGLALVVIGYAPVTIRTLQFSKDPIVAQSIGIFCLALGALVLIQGLRLTPHGSAPGAGLRRKHRWAASAFGKAARSVWRHPARADGPIPLRVALSVPAVIVIAAIWLVLLVYWVLVLVAAGLVAGMGPFQPAPR